MWLLAIESATERASVALARDATVAGVRATPPGHPASETLLPAALALLAEHGLGPDAPLAFAVSIGPGSFTGLRVGVATVKGLAFGSPGPVAAVPTLAALATLAEEPVAPVVALLDARRGEVYVAAYEAGDPLAAPRWGPSVLTPDELAARVEPGWTLIGEPVEGVAERVRAVHGDAVRLALSTAPDAGAVARLGARLLAAGAGVPAEELAPAYLRRAEAEVRRTGSRFEPPGGDAP